MRCKFAVDHGCGLVECMGYGKACCDKQRYDTNDDGSINIVECVDVKGEDKFGIDADINIMLRGEHDE